jgi:hypothetical protein
MIRGPGKIKIDADVYLVLRNGKMRVDDAAVYIHLKGHMRARVTHIDVEDRILGKIIHHGRGNMLKITGIDGGIEIEPKEPREMDIEEARMMIYGLEVHQPLLNEVLRVGLSTVTWVGRKYDGIYIGFREAEMKRLEQVAEKGYGVMPRNRSGKKRQESETVDMWSFASKAI